MRRIVEAPTRCPTLSSSPWILRYPQLGFPRYLHHQGGEHFVDRRPSWPVWIRPPPAHQMAMPTQDGARGDQAMATQSSRQPPDEGGEERPICPVQPWFRVGAA